MTTASPDAGTGQNSQPPQPNPFPSAAVARLSSDTLESVNILTPATTRALSYVDNYLSGANSPQNDKNSTNSLGNILAIIGEYGTGKTHLALQLLRRLEGPDYKFLHSLYLDAPADTFLALYRDRFFPKLSKIDVKQRVAEYYADIVAEELAASELTERIADSLKARETSANDVVRNLGLMESDYLQSLKLKLRAVTEIDEFSTALTLLLRPEFEDAAWEWLSCAEPDSVLVERGIIKAIDTEAEALEAMGVIALLYGTQKHRFVVVIDELEKVLSREERTLEDSAVLAFKKLLEVFGSTRAFLVLSGLPDFLEVLPEDARQRIGCLVRPAALSTIDATRYIEEVQERAFGKKRLRPFNEDVVRYLVSLAGGNPRKIIRLCYHAYQSSVTTGTDVTRAMLRNAARDQFELIATEDVKGEIGRLLDSNGWRFERNRVLKQEGKSAVRLDYWVPTASDAAGCAILVSNSILDEKYAKTLHARAKSLLDISPVPVQLLLVVNGYMAENLRSHVTNFDKVLTHDLRNFADDLDASLKGMRIRLESKVEENTLQVIRTRVEELARQTAGVRSTVEELFDVSINSERYERAAENGLRRVLGQLSSGSSSGPSRRTDPALDEVFQYVETSLAWTIESLDQLVDSVFQVGRSRSRIESPDRLADVLTDGPFLDFLGPLNLALRCTRRFKESVAYFLDNNIYRRNSLHSPPLDLESLCRSFDVIVNRIAHAVRWGSIFDEVNELRRRAGIASPPPSHRYTGDISAERFVDELHSLGRRTFDYFRERGY